ncbi:MAG: hypothetical protein NVSMB2_08720 [Chloroflexota bacterium]
MTPTALTSYWRAMRSAGSFGVILLFLHLLLTPIQPAGAAEYADALPDDGSAVCGLTTDTPVIVFIGDGAMDACQARSHPMGVGPDGWSDIPADSLADAIAPYTAPQCTFHLVGIPPVLTRVYAASANSDSRVICTGLTQFFPSLEASGVGSK